MYIQYSNNLREHSHHKIQISYTEKGRVKHVSSKNKKKDKRSLQAPRSDWINRIKPYGPVRSDLAKRFELMLDWGRLGGLRALEICRLEIKHLPQRETAEKARTESRLLPTKLTTTKGGRTETVRVPPSLVLATWDYIDFYREQTIKNFARRSKKAKSKGPYKPSKYVFLSDQTGTCMSPGAFSNSVRKAFLAAVLEGDLTIDERVWPHGLRHNFVTKFLKESDKKGIKNPERFTMQGSRHGSLDAMQVYTGDRFSEDFN